MSNKKIRKYIAAAAAAVMAVCVPAHPVPAAAERSAPVSQPGAILDAEPRKLPGEDSFVTGKVERGTLSVEAQAEGTPQFSDWRVLFFDNGYEAGIFVKFCVEIGDYVEKGQPIAEFKAQANEIDVESAKLRLSRAQQDQKETQEACEKRLASAERAVKESTGTALRIAELDLEKCRLETERTLREADARVAELEELVQKYQEEQEKLLYLAPMSGYIYDLENKQPNMLVWSGDRLGLMYGRREQIFSVPDGSGLFRYGMNMRVTDKTTGVDVPGKVVSCSAKYLSSAFKDEFSYIRIDEQTEAQYRVVLFYETLHMENVLRVSVDAVKSDSGGTYVTELKDGKKIKHYFLMGKRTKEYCHVIDGLTEGMVVMIY